MTGRPRDAVRDPADTPGQAMRSIALHRRFRATGLVLLTICATVYQLLAQQPASAIFAAVMCLLCATVALGRWRRLASARRASGQPAVATATS